MSVTIAIPFYNAEKYLLDAIRSVFAQSYSNWELLLIDDGSTDTSLNIAKSIADPRVHIFSDGKNMKLAARLNQIAKLANYEYLARMDADDLMTPDRIEVQLNFLKANPHFDLVTAGVYSTDNDLNLQSVRVADFKNPTQEDIICRNKGITHACILGKTEWFLRNQYNENLTIAQDLDLWIRAAGKNDLKIKSLAQPLYIYREENNVTKDKLLRAYSNEINIIKKHYNKNTYIHIGKARLKMLVVKFLAIIGQLSKLQSNRGNLKITDAIEATFHNHLKKIRSISLPKT